VVFCPFYVVTPSSTGFNQAAVAALPISFRLALLAGQSRAIAHHAVLDAIRDETMFRGERPLNASANKPGSTPMQHEKAIQRENFVGYIFSS
jgi:hypothetical protein